ncbi:hypothetical protein ACEPAI_8421 [Sanghuangporus weigelae]
MLALIQKFLRSTTTNTGKNTPSTSGDPSLIPSSKIVIVGSGCFGVSTALHLLRRGYRDVTILERASELPAVDAASTDINKIVRSSYNDEFYTLLAREALEAWKDHEVWGRDYYESGVLVCGIEADLHGNRAFQNDHKHGARIKKIATLIESDETGRLATSEADKLETVTLEEIFDPGVSVGSSISRTHGYFNEDGGWVYSKRAMERAMELVEKLDGKIIPGKEVSSTIKDQSRTRGVKCKDGSEFAADIVILAIGCWTASTFPELKLGRRALATGQATVTVQLTPEEGERYRKMPVILDLGPSGFYCFPPNEDNLIKMGSHVGGVTNMVPIADAPTVDVISSGISSPRTTLSHGVDGLKVPKSEARFVRECFGKVFPELGEKPFNSTRLCWYTDSPDSNWIIDVHPADPGLALVTAGSGHGFKFLPVIGRLVADRLEGKMDESTRRRFAVEREFDEHTTYRDGAVISALDPDDLIGVGEDC